jgi:hypothetical protein
MIRLQLVERDGAKLFAELRGAMRSGSLRTFSTKNRGRKVVHANPTYTGWMNWTHVDGVITCTIVSPRKPGGEWQFFSAFIGRLADRFADKIHNVNVQFVPAPAKVATVKRKTKRRARPSR